MTFAPDVTRDDLQALVDAAAPQDVEPGAAKFDDETHVNQIV